jgi:hypothetical protein
MTFEKFLVGMVGDSAVLYEIDSLTSLTVKPDMTIVTDRQGTAMEVTEPTVYDDLNSAIDALNKKVGLDDVK